MATRYTGPARIVIRGDKAKGETYVRKARELLGTWDDLNSGNLGAVPGYIRKSMLPDGTVIQGTRVDGMYMVVINVESGGCIFDDHGFFLPSVFFDGIDDKKGWGKLNKITNLFDHYYIQYLDTDRSFIYAPDPLAFDAFFAGEYLSSGFIPTKSKSSYYPAITTVRPVYRPGNAYGTTFGWRTLTSPVRIMHTESANLDYIVNTLTVKSKLPNTDFYTPGILSGYDNINQEYYPNTHLDYGGSIVGNKFIDIKALADLELTFGVTSMSKSRAGTYKLLLIELAALPELYAGFTDSIPCNIYESSVELCDPLYKQPTTKKLVGTFNIPLGVYQGVSGISVATKPYGTFQAHFQGITQDCVFDSNFDIDNGVKCTFIAKQTIINVDTAYPEDNVPMGNIIRVFSLHLFINSFTGLLDTTLTEEHIGHTYPGNTIGENPPEITRVSSSSSDTLTVNTNITDTPSGVQDISQNYAIASGFYEGVINILEVFVDRTGNTSRQSECSSIRDDACSLHPDPGQSYFDVHQDHTSSGSSTSSTVSLRYADSHNTLIDIQLNTSAYATHTGNGWSDNQYVCENGVPLTSSCINAYYIDAYHVNPFTYNNVCLQYINPSERLYALEVVNMQAEYDNTVSVQTECPGNTRSVNKTWDIVANTTKTHTILKKGLTLHESSIGPIDASNTFDETTPGTMNCDYGCGSGCTVDDFSVTFTEALMDIPVEVGAALDACTNVWTGTGWGAGLVSHYYNRYYTYVGHLSMMTSNLGGNIQEYVGDDFHYTLTPNDYDLSERFVFSSIVGEYGYGYPETIMLGVMHPTPIGGAFNFTVCINNVCTDYGEDHALKDIKDVYNSMYNPVDNGVYYNACTKRGF